MNMQLLPYTHGWINSFYSKALLGTYAKLLLNKDEEEEGRRSRAYYNSLSRLNFSELSTSVVIDSVELDDDGPEEEEKAAWDENIAIEARLALIKKKKVNAKRQKEEDKAKIASNVTDASAHDVMMPSTPSASLSTYSMQEHIAAKSIWQWQ